MTQQEMKQLACELSALSVFRGILKQDAMAALLQVLDLGENTREKMEAYGAFVSTLAEDNCSLSDFLCRAVYEDENPYVIGTAKGRPLPQVMMRNAQRELKLLSRLTQLDVRALCGEFDGSLPEFDNTPTDLLESYRGRLENIQRYGYGVFASSKMFRVAGEEIIPVKTADDVSMDSFIGYQEERQKVYDNTKALVEGREAANVLLFGDAGTGKSSTVKACVNHFYDQGLRLIELRKDQLFSLPYVMSRIAENPLKFIIFIDDLSFNKNDDSFSMLKAALEGSASAKTGNAVIYATSNRRHIVKERFSDRHEADDVHHSDTVQELMSLSDRFGLTVYFSRPNKQLYLEIVHALAQKKNLPMDAKQLEIQAEAFALSKGSRSPRAAEQFVNSLLIKE